MSWSVATPIAVPDAAAAHSLSMAGVTSVSGFEYALWVDADGRILYSRFPGFSPAVDFFTPFALSVPPPEPARQPVPDTSRVAAVGTEDFLWVVWVGAGGKVQLELHNGETVATFLPVRTFGAARPDSALAAAEIRPWRTFSWVTPDARLSAAQFVSDAIRREAVLGAPGSVRPDTPIALTAGSTMTHVLWVAADGTLMASASARQIVGEAGWSTPAPIRDGQGRPAAVAPGDTLAVTNRAVMDPDHPPEAVWLDPDGALRSARLETDTWGAARLLLAAGPARRSGPVRVLSDAGMLEVLFATPDGGIAAFVPALASLGAVTLAGPTGGGATELSVCVFAQGRRAAVWRTADGSVVHMRRRPESFGAAPAGPRPSALPLAGDARVDPASARYELRQRHSQSVEAFWVRPDGALGILAGRQSIGSPPIGSPIPTGWRWRAAAVARPGLLRTSPPGAIAKLHRDENRFALVWVQPDGSVRSIAFDGTEVVESPQWRLPVQVAPPGSAATVNPAVTATVGPAGAPAGEESVYWLTPTRTIGAARRDDTDPTWKAQTPPAALARADSTLLADTLPGRRILVWVDANGVPVLATKTTATGSGWVPSPAPAGKRAYTVAPRGRLVTAGTDPSRTILAWVDIDGIVRVAAVEMGGAWGDAVQHSDPGIADAASLSMLGGDRALAWLLPDGTVVQQGQRLITGPAAARTILGSVQTAGGTVLVLAMPDGKLGFIQRGGS